MYDFDKILETGLSLNRETWKYVPSISQLTVTALQWDTWSKEQKNSQFSQLKPTERSIPVLLACHMMLSEPLSLCVKQPTTPSFQVTLLSIALKYKCWWNRNTYIWKTSVWCDLVIILFRVWFLKNVFVGEIFLLRGKLFWRLFCCVNILKYKATNILYMIAFMVNIFCRRGDLHRYNKRCRGQKQIWSAQSILVITCPTVRGRCGSAFVKVKAKLFLYLYIFLIHLMSKCIKFCY